MSLNRTNMLVDSNDPQLARADINDMFADIGYSTSGSVSPITTTGEANKLFKFSAIANTILHFLRIRKSSTTALNVQDDSSVDVLNVDSTNKIVTSYNQKVTGLAGTGTRMVLADSAGNLIANSKILRGYVYLESGSTATIPLPEIMPATTYTIVATSNRVDYNGIVTTTVRDKLLNEFKIHYWGADGVGAGIEWILIY